nr:hypothetical protein [Amnimonas aquatica]
MLAGVVDAVERQRDAPHHARNIDQQTGPALAEVRQHGAADLHEAENIGLELAPHLRLVQGLERAHERVAGIVDHHIDGAEALEGDLDGLRDAVLVVHIQRRTDDIGQLRQLRLVGRIAHGGRDIPAASLEMPGGGQADPGGSTGDQYRFLGLLTHLKHSCTMRLHLT